MCVVSRSARCCGERGRGSASSSASTRYDAMYADTGARGGTARASSALGCHREVDHQQGEHAVLKSAPMAESLPLRSSSLAKSIPGHKPIHA